MAQLDRIQIYSDQSPKTPKAQPSSPTFEQLLQAQDSGNSSPVRAKNLEREEHVLNNNRKSVLSRMKDKAKKLKHTLSSKKIQEYQEENTTLPTGVSLADDDEEGDEDPEYLGAPMYESELAPESYKETARQHPRAEPVISEMHAVPNRTQHEGQEEKTTPSKTITETVSEKLAPAYAAVSDMTQAIASTFVNLKISSPKEQENRADIPVTPSMALSNAVDSAATDSKYVNQKPQGPSDEIVNSPRKRDKGVYVKEYLAHKLEPGDNERALSQVLSDALSPRKSSGDTGMMEKMRGVVTSFLRDEGPTQCKTNMTNSSTTIHLSAGTKLSPQSSISSVSTNLSPRVPVCSSANSSPLIPVSTNPHEVTEEENHGRVLQAN